jgi:2,3-bisphosphoglycerate-dependent phosphoglycerate mutase
MPTLILMRHGQSAWNLENRFTGWWDVSLTDQGIEEARAAGRALLNAGFKLDVAYTSLLTRAVHTLNLALEQADQLWLPVIKDWRLNERHYGGLTGLNKAETMAKHGEDQVFIWRRSFDVPPPLLDAQSEFDVSHDRRYAGIATPQTESLKDTIARVLPVWNDHVAVDLRAGKSVIMSAHGNSLRALVKHLDSLSDAEITSVEIPTGSPLIYQLDDTLVPLEKYYLKDRISG